MLRVSQISQRPLAPLPHSCIQYLTLQGTSLYTQRLGFLTSASNSIPIPSTLTMMMVNLTAEFNCNQWPSQVQTAQLTHVWQQLCQTGTFITTLTLKMQIGVTHRFTYKLTSVTQQTFQKTIDTFLHTLLLRSTVLPLGCWHCLQVHQYSSTSQEILWHSLLLQVQLYVQQLL